LLLEWFHPSDTVGITAGTSTPDSLIDAVENWLSAHYPACTFQQSPQRAVAGLPLSKLNAH
jgi:4-hydroxy-3-methylbut-2-enyl diphosphate reductase IspH